MYTSQVVTNIAAVGKELVGNAFDADATTIVNTHENHGIASIKVTDIGSELAKDHIPFINLPHHTLKISNFDDIASVVSYGFRGEAMSALAALGNVDVIA